MAEPSLPFVILRTFICACVSLISLFLAFIILVLVGFLRLIINIVLRYHYKSRFQLITPLDALYMKDYYGKLCQMNVVFLAQTSFTQIDLDILRKTLEARISSPSGIYRKLQFFPCVKFGFLCWEDLGQSDSFDINHHVKLCPGIESWEKVYPEDELQSRFNKLLSSPVSNDRRPKWEILFIPKIRTKSTTSQSQVGVIIRMNHGYMDGISFYRFLINCLWDEGELIKPNLLGASKKTASTLTDLCRLYLHLFLYGPLLVIRLLLDPDRNIYYDGTPNPGTLFLGSLKVKNTNVSRIRGAFSVQTTSLITSAFLSALNNIAERKGLETPSSVNVTASRGLQPYPESHEPINHFILYCKRLLIYTGFKDTIKQLVAANKMMHLGPENEYEILTCLYTSKFVGLMPEKIGKYVTKAFSMFSLVVTLTPLSEQVLGFQGAPITSVVGIAPVANGLRYSLGISNYAGHFYISSLAAKSAVIQNQHDMDDLIGELEDSIKKLHEKAVESNESRNENNDKFGAI